MKHVALFLVVFLFSFAGMAQELDSIMATEPAEETVQQEESENKLPKPKLDKSRIYYGGYMTMNFSKNYSVLGAAPMVAYKLTPKFSVGGQITYEYISDKRYTIEQNGSNYGFSLFSRYRVSPRLYAHTEFELMSYKWFYSDGGDERKWAPMFYVGGGYSQPISKNVWLNAQVLFDVLNHENSPYNDWEPYFSVGIGVGF